MKLVLSTLVAAGAVLTPIAAQAVGEYYIEIGHDAPGTDAQKEWQDLSAKHKDLLGHLKFYPKQVIREGAPVTTRIQAGPVKDRPTAEKTCALLFKDNVPCFVLEGLTEAPPASIISLTEKAAEAPVEVPLLPWVAKPAPRVSLPPEEPVTPTATQEPVKMAVLPPLPWLVNRPVEKGEVKVAEAVRVPAGEPEPAAVPPLPAPAIPGTGSGWLSVGTFLDQETAGEFWDNLRGSLPAEMTVQLRTRISGPAMPHDVPSTTLAIGPFATRDDAYAFCTAHVQTRDKDLRCLFEPSRPAQESEPEAVIKPYQHEADYAARRERIAEERQGDLPAPAAESMQMYWVQVLSAPSELEALNQWDDLRDANADLLGGLRNSISPVENAGATTSYVVRLGPVTGDGNAVKLCKSLQERSIDCNVLRYSSR